MDKEALWHGLLSFKYGDLDKVLLADACLVGSGSSLWWRNLTLLGVGNNSSLWRFFEKGLAEG